MASLLHSNVLSPQKNKKRKKRKKTISRSFRFSDYDRCCSLWLCTRDGGVLGVVIIYGMYLRRTFTEHKTVVAALRVDLLLSNSSVHSQGQV